MPSRPSPCSPEREKPGESKLIEVRLTLSGPSNFSARKKEPVKVCVSKG